MRKERYPIGIQNFPEVRRGGYVYVDKTSYIIQLLDSGKFFFLSRPRRFGKSLFMSTLRAYFEGRRELFTGLDIDTDEVNWTPRPVLMLSLNTLGSVTCGGLDAVLEKAISEWEEIYGSREYEKDFATRFGGVIRRAYEQTGHRAAILVDEYDAPLLASFGADNVHLYFRDILKGLFSVIKASDEYVFFAMLTGVSRFSQTSLFSGPNNLDDITMDDRFSSICGITESELIENFKSGIEDFSQKEGTDESEIVRLLKENYDGYHFTKSCPDIYNPFSLLCALGKMEFDNYWFNSGTPSFLVTALRNENFFLPDLDGIETEQSDLSSIESYRHNPAALLFETGYLTIKSYDRETRLFKLGLPNKEVSHSFVKFLLPFYIESYSSSTITQIKQMQRFVFAGEADKFMSSMQSFMASIPYPLIDMKAKEKYFQNNFYLILKTVGFDVLAEYPTSSGRMDLLMKTTKFAYIIELKLNASASEALEQIETKQYSLGLKNEHRQIILIGANYDSTNNCIGSWEVKKI